LLFAAQQGDVESARMLLAAGTDVNEATAEEGTALVVASASGHEKLAVFLLEMGADPNAKGGFGITPLHYALNEGLLALSVFKPSSTDQFGWTRSNMPALVKALLARGADPNARIAHDSPPYDTPLLSRSRGLDLAQLTMAGATPFLLATASADLDLMRVLVEGRANARLGTADGSNPVMVAAGIGRERCGYGFGGQTGGEYQKPARKCSGFWHPSSWRSNWAVTSTPPMSGGRPPCTPPPSWGMRTLFASSRKRAPTWTRKTNTGRRL
jgi:ankyrin repeat protein